jgi:transglutaminase-like putative cysteine protease
MQAQPVEELTTYRQKYPDESAVMLNKKQHVSIRLDEGEISILTSFYEEQFLLDDKASLFAEESIEYSGFYDVYDIKGKTLVPGKKRYKAIPIGEIKEKDEFSAGIFYDDIKSKNFFYPALEEGTKKVLSYKKDTKEPRFLNSFFLADYIPIEYQEFTIESDPSIELEFTYFNATPEELNFKKEQVGERIRYSWTRSDVAKLKSEDAAPGQLHYVPHIIPRIAAYHDGNERVRLLSEVDDLFGWYMELIAKMDFESSEELIDITNELVQDETDEFQKVKNIYDWVQNNIKYIAVENGLGGFIPRDAATVCKNRYGDCKDMSSILIKMMDIAGIKGYFTWVGTRKIPYSYEEVPTPSVDNHMIATYIAGDRYYFLDATGQYTPIEMPSGFIQGKEVMINRDGAFELVEVPVVPAAENGLFDTVNVKLSGRQLAGEGKSLFTGYHKIRMTERISRMTEKERMKYFKSFYNKGSNRFLLDELNFNHLEDKYTPLEVTYHFNIADYAGANDDELYVNLNLDKPLLNNLIEKERKLPIERDYQRLTQHVVKFTVPDGYRVTYLPENSSYQHEAFAYEISYQQQGNEVLLTTSLTINHLQLELEQFADWNSMIQSLGEAYAEVLVLKEVN